MKSPILGPAYTARSKNLSDCRCINLYAEVAESKQGKEIAAFYMAPGLDLKTTCGAGPVRGYCVMQGVLYAVSGTGLYAVLASWQAILVGTLFTGVGPVSMITNGTQLLIADGYAGYLFQGGSFMQQALPFSGPLQLAYQDGFGLALQLASQTWWQSNLFDLSTWQALNFDAADGAPDNIVAIADIHREVWLFKANETEIWINAGLPGFAFQRLDGPYIQQGCVAPYSAVACGEALLWLAQNAEGQGEVHSASGLNGSKRISTHAVEQEWAGYPMIADAQGYAYRQEGHLFYVLTFPAGNATWAYDVTASEQLGVAMWYHWAAFLNGSFGRHWGNCFVNFNGRQLVGDYLTGNIYALNLNTLTDNGQRRKWLRSWRALQPASVVPMRFPALQITMETGMAVPAGTNPQAVLRWSDDGGHTWSAERYAAVGPTGAVSQRVKFNRLGSTRQASGLDRIFELSSSDQFRVGITGADIIE